MWPTRRQNAKAGASCSTTAPSAISRHSTSLSLSFYLHCPWRLPGRTAASSAHEWDREQARRERGKGVGVVGLVVYQVSNTEANELPGLSGLASRQHALTPTLPPPLLPLQPLLLFPLPEQHIIIPSFLLSRVATLKPLPSSLKPLTPEHSPPPPPLHHNLNMFPSRSCSPRSFFISCRGIERQVLR